MDDDCWLPGVSREIDALTRGATISCGEASGRVALLSGEEREVDKNVCHHWEGQPGESITISWPEARPVETFRLILDSDLNNSKTMPCRYTLEGEDMPVPASLVKAFTLEGQCDGGQWETLHREEENCRRLVVLSIRRSLRALRWTGLSTWGAPLLRVFSLEASSKALPVSSLPPAGKNWNDVTAALDPVDLAEPDHGLEPTRNRSRIGA